MILVLDISMMNWVKFTVACDIMDVDPTTRSAGDDIGRGLSIQYLLAASTKASHKILGANLFQ